MRSSVSCRLCASVRSHSQSRLAKLHKSPLSRHVKISEEVQDALHRSQAVVSLETAITSHGLPYDQAVSTAKSLDNIIRKGGAVPAVIGLIDGVIKIGLTDSEIERLADPASSTSGTRPEKWKVGKRDIAPALVKKVDGGTTVSATSFLSKLAGIDVFVTGGIGGVHRGATETLDVSSDLTELGRSSTTVVCAGAKSILDIGLTLEYLETLGVTVTTFGPSKDFPAFYARKSGFQSPSCVRTATEAAQLIHFSKLLKTKSGILIGVPIPEQYEVKSIAIQQAVEQAVRESEENGIAKRGKEVTPWILAKVKELTGGESVESNIALIENNARIGAAISVELARVVQESAPNTSRIYGSASPSTSSNDGRHRQSPKRIAVVGAAAVDIVSKPMQSTAATSSAHNGLVLKTTVPGSTDLRLGGVARNVHEAAFKLGAHSAVLVAPVGGHEDLLAAVLEDGLKALGASTEGLIRKAGRTPSVNMILDGEGTLEVGVAATQLVESLEGKEIVKVLREVRPQIVCFDGNLSEQTIKCIIDHCSAENITSAFEPTSDLKALKLLESVGQADSGPLITHFTPNLQEVRAFARHARSLSLHTNSPRVFGSLARGKYPYWISPDDIRDVACVLRYTRYLWLKGGAHGLCVFFLDTAGEVSCKPFVPLAVETIKNSVGAGDSLMGGILAGLAHGLEPSGQGLEMLAQVAQRAAVATLASDDAVGVMDDTRHLLLSSSDSY